MIKNDEKAMRKPKLKRAKETQMLGGMPKLQEKVKSKTDIPWPKQKEWQNKR